MKFKESKFILVNDPDHSDFNRTKMVFSMLNEYKIKITSAVFCTMEKDDTELSKHCYKGETEALDNPEYAEFMLKQRELGHEIAFHGYSQISNKRSDFQKGLDIYRNVFGELPFTYVEHGGIPIHHKPEQCKKERLDWFGSVEDSDYFVKDLIQKNI